MTQNVFDPREVNASSILMINPSQNHKFSKDFIRIKTMNPKSAYITINSWKLDLIPRTYKSLILEITMTFTISEIPKIKLL